MKSEKSEDEWTIHALNIQGTFFEQACVKQISKAVSWNVLSDNYPVEYPPPNGHFRGKESSLDIWARKEENSHILDAFVECKKANPEFVNWVFFEKRQTKQPPTPRILEVENIQSEKNNAIWNTSSQLISLMSEIPVVTDAREVRGNYQAIKDNKSKTKTSNAAIQDAAYQVALATRAMISEEQLLLKKAAKSNNHPVPPWGKKYYIPIICTTAKLHIAQFDPNSVNLGNGEINSDKVTLVPTPIVIFEYPLPKHLQHSPADPLNVLNSNDTETFSRMHVFVVQSESLEGFMNDLFKENDEKD